MTQTESTPTLARLEFSRIRTPEAQGEALVEPPPAAMGAMVAANQALARGWNAPILDLDLRTAREQVRKAVAGAAADKPLIVLGHQPEFLHPGVWAKNVVAMRLAEAVRGTAINLVVDTDTPKHNYLFVPTDQGGRPHLQPVPYSILGANRAYEMLPRTEGPLLQEFLGGLHLIGQERFDRSLLSTFSRVFADAGPDDDFVDQMVAARRAAEAELGIGLRDVRISQCWTSALLADMLVNAERFAGCYNEALAAYRRAQGVSGTQRPIPDLLHRNGQVELPVWLLCPKRGRRRLFVRRNGDALTLFGGEDECGTVSLGDLKTWERAEATLSSLSRVQFRPRALTLTLWARLLLADVFIHGIGGAKYDRITDRLVECYFGIEPPGMACVSATLRLDLPRHGVSDETLRQARRRLRDVQHNPQRHISRDDSELQAVVAERARAVSESQRLRRQDPANRSARRSAFDSVRAANRRIHELRPRLVGKAEADLERVRKQLTENEIAQRRDYFFAMHDRRDLARLGEALPRVEDFGV